MSETIPDPADAPAKTSQKSRHFRSRSAARLAAVQALYQMEQSGAGFHQVKKEFIEHRLGETPDDGVSFAADEAYFVELLEGASIHQQELDAQISSALSTGWSLDRLESVVRAILRVGVFELKEMVHMPAPIILNEYIDITHAFFEGKEPAFVNGILHKLAAHFRPTDNENAP